MGTVGLIETNRYEAEEASGKTKPITKGETMFSLNGKVAIVTGAASGIGLATAQLFCAQGAKVLFVDIQEQQLRLAMADVSYSDASYCVADVSIPSNAEGYVKAAVERFGGVDILIANAGVLGPVAPIPDYPLEAWDRLLAVNLRGPWLGIKYAMPEIQKRGGGSIVITSSIAGVKGFPMVSAYSSVKHGLVGLMKTAAIEGGPMNIRVNTVHPGPIETPMIHLLEEGFAPGAPEQGHQALEGATLLKRYAAPEEVAHIMLFLASDEGTYCTGGIYMIDGGMALS